MSKALDICRSVVNKFGVAEANAYFVSTVCMAPDVLMDGSGSTVREKIRVIATLKNSLAIFILANEDAVAEKYVVVEKYERMKLALNEAAKIVIKNVETMPTRTGRGFNVRLSTSLGILMYCISDIEREMVLNFPSLKKQINTEQCKDLLKFKRNINSLGKVYTKE